MNHNLILRILCFVFLISRILLAQSNEEKLEFSHKRGFYEAPFTLTLSTTTPGLTIRYTVDGTNPLTSQNVWSGVSPVKIPINPANTLVRDMAPGFCLTAVVIQSDTAVTKIKTHTYIFPDKVVELSPDGQRPGEGWIAENMSGDEQFINYGMDLQVCNNSQYKNKIVPALQAIPTLSMVIDLKHLFDPATGIYVNALEHGSEWERPCSLELLPYENTDDFQINCGVRIRGGYSRHNFNPKRAFRFFFRKEYGEGKLKYPLFEDEGVDEFDCVDLRTSMNYSWGYDGSSLNTMNRDVFSRDSQRDMGQPYTRSRYYHLYINGTYWGLYQTQERSEASYAAAYFGGEKEDYDVIKVGNGSIEATDGFTDAWRKLWELSNTGFDSDEIYYQAIGCNPDGARNPEYDVLVDIDNLIDYMLITFLAGDYDGPISNFGNNQSINNFYCIYNRNGAEGFKFFKHDAEHTLRDYEWGYDRTGPFPAGASFNQFNPQWLHQKLVENPNYRTRFADHVYKHFFDNGALTPEANQTRFLSRAEEIELAIIAESARWGDSKHEPAYTKDNAWLPAINWIVDEYFPTRTEIVLNQIKAKSWYPQTSPPVFNRNSGRVVPGYRLTINAPQGKIYYTMDGTDPFQPASSSNTYFNLIDENAAVKIFIPTEDIGTDWRTKVNFDDTVWDDGINNVGYERSSGYENWIKTNVESEMYQTQTSCYIRIPFNINQSDLAEINYLKLNMRYDDGFVVFLNGTQVAAAVNPATLNWNANAPDNHEAEGWESFVISDFSNNLKTGENLLAIHGLNYSLTSSDFIISVELVAGTISNEGSVSPNALEYDQAIQINQTTQIKARTLAGSDWSAASEATLYVLEGLENLKITEIHYHPLDDGSEENNDSEFEFIELKNIGAEPLNLTGVYFSRGIQYAFPANTTLDAGEFFVLASNSQAFGQRYGFNPFGEYEGQLDNSGERLALNSSLADTLIVLRYNDNYPWPASPDGAGFSLVTKEINPYKNPADAANWAASSKVHGTPGYDDIHVSVETTGEKAPLSYTLFQNYPNPFNPETTFRFQNNQPGKVSLKIFNILGQLVATLTNQYYPSGVHTVHWNANDMAAGLYFCHMEGKDFVAMKKILFIK